MSKAFVIKNKEGKYAFALDSNTFTDEIINALIYNEYEKSLMLEEYPNLNFVEITIAEDDLEQENKQLKEQLAEKDKEIERLTTPCEYYINYNNHIIRKLPLGEEEILLTPKEICDLLNGYAHEFMDIQERYAEWKRHKLSQYNSKKNYVREVVEKQIRKQVCDEIRKLEARYRYDGENVIEGYFIDKEKLFQIEQAKESIDGKIDN